MKKFVRLVGRSKKALVAAGVFGSSLALAGISHAAITIPEMPTTDLETAGGVVLAFVAVGAVIGMIASRIKRAG